MEGEESDVRKLTDFLNILKSSTRLSWQVSPLSSPQNEIFDESSAAILDDIVKLRKCLDYNVSYYSMISSVEFTILLLIEQCVREQRILKARIEAFERGRNGELLSSRSMETFIRTTFQMPYFKDSDGFSYSYNIDVQRRRNKFLNLCEMCKHRMWYKNEEDVVKKFIRQAEEEKWMQTLKRCGMLHLAKIDEMSLADLVESRVEEYDWLTLSVTHLKNAHSPNECRAVWINCLHPLINQQAWSEEESSKLRELAIEQNHQDWQQIALNLGTKRSGFQCIIQFKRSFTAEEKGDWSVSQVEYLNKIVTTFKVLKYIPWNKVTAYIDGHSYRDIYSQWNKMHSQGEYRTFSFEEDIILVAGMRVFGSNYSQIGDFLPNRSTTQVRNRISVLMGRQFSYKPWSRSEDVLLEELIEKYGFGNWLKISMHFVNRDPTSVRKRYNTLQNNIKKHGENTLSASRFVRNPPNKLDIVNIDMLWKATQNICEENGLDWDFNVQSPCEPRCNILQELSSILKPRMRHHKMIERKKLIPALDKAYIEFFLPASTDFTRSCRKSFLDKRLIHTQVYNLLITLKLLRVELQLPQISAIEKDNVLPNVDKSVLKYIVKRKFSFCKRNRNRSYFVSKNENITRLVIKTNVTDKSIPYIFLFPPNVSSLMALKTHYLHCPKLKHQEEGLTLQLDNTELKYALHSCCTLKYSRSSKKYQTACKLWNNRIIQLLFWSAIVSNHSSEEQ